MKKSTIAIWVLSGIIILQAVLLCNFFTRFIILDTIDPNNPETGYVLTNDVVLTSWRGHAIPLPVGTILHGPCRHDLAYTDLGDPRVWKVFVESDHGTLQHCGMAIPDAPRDFPFTGMLGLKLSNTQESSEQGAAPLPPAPQTGPSEGAR